MAKNAAVEVKQEGEVAKVEAFAFFSIIAVPTSNSFQPLVDCKMEIYNGCEVDPGEKAVAVGLTEMVDKFNNILQCTTDRHNALHPLSPARLSL